MNAPSIKVLQETILNLENQINLLETRNLKLEKENKKLKKITANRVGKESSNITNLQKIQRRLGNRIP